jgi:hypothetical protein
MHQHETFITASNGQRKNIRTLVVALLTAGAVGGWATSMMFATNAAAVQDVKATFEGLKPILIGSYVVNGTDPDGKRYSSTSMLSIALAPSGALEIDWDNGKQVGVGQLIGNVLAVSYSVKGRSAILIMNIDRDGSLSGRWSRRGDVPSFVELGGTSAAC